MLDGITAVVPYAFTVLVIHGALSDLSRFRIPNWVSYGLILLFGLQALVAWSDTSALSAPEAGRLAFLPGIGMAAAVFAIGLVFWRLGLIGGGDVKYLTAISAWMGVGLALPFIVLLTALAAAFAVMLKLLGRWELAIMGAYAPAMLKRLLARMSQNQLPYGVPIGLATLLMIPKIFAA